MIPRIVTLLLLAASLAHAQLSYVNNSGLSYSTAYVGQDLQPTPGQFDQYDELGTIDTLAEATWDNDESWADANLSAGGIFDYVQASAGYDNTEHAGPPPTDENAAWSYAQQSGDWNTGEQSVTYTFIVNLEMSHDTATANALYWSTNNWLSGEAEAGPYSFEWSLSAGTVTWTLFDNGSQIDSGTANIWQPGGGTTNWIASVSESVTDSSPDSTESVSCCTYASAFDLLGYWAVRAGDAQTGVIVSD